MSVAVPKALERAGDMIAPTLASAAESLSPELRRVVEYHWGWVDADGCARPSRGGKALRPALALLSAEAVGRPPRRALAAAAAVEIVHDFTLLHDDVMDEDRERRGRPAAWTVFGIGAAICAGDALVPLAQRILLSDPSPRRVEALERLGEAIEAVIAGQALDLCFETRRDVGTEEYLHMAAGKTGALLSGAASIGACLAEGPAPAVDALARFGASLGVAFQAMDDWLGIWGDPEKTGKPVASDLRRRKASLPIVSGASEATPAGKALRRLLASRDPIDEPMLAEALGWLDETGAEATTLDRARHELEAAARRLEGAPIEPEARDALLEIASFVVERNA